MALGAAPAGAGAGVAAGAAAGAAAAHKAAGATDEAQRAREASLKGKRLLFVGGDFMYKGFAPSLVRLLQRLRALGVVIHGVFQARPEGPSKYFRDQEAGGCFDHHTFADIGAEAGAENVAAAVRSAGWDVQYAYSMHDSTQLIVAKVQELLGMPGNPVAAYEVARDKYAARKCLERAGLATIQAMQVWKAEDADEVARRIGFPAIIKPTVGMGSAGVYRCNDKAELVANINRLFGDIKTDWALNRNTIGKQAPVLAETCVIPTLFGGGRVNEHDVEVLMWDGECVYANIIDNWTTRPPYFQEVASNMPTLMDAEQQRAMIDYAIKCVKAMGFTRGGFHTECWMTPAGPLLIEVNARVGGGATVESHVECFGVHPMFEMAMAMMDVPINPPRALEPLCTYGYLLPNAEVTGELREDATFLDVAKASPFYYASTYFRKSGPVKGNDTAVAEWLGEVHLKHGDRDAVLNEMERLLKEISDAASAQTTPAPKAPVAPAQP